MDAVEYLKEKARMTCSNNGGSCNIDCYDCPLGSKNNGDMLCTVLEAVQPEKAIAIVKKWAAEHPVKTRQSEFLKMFPNAVIRDLCIDIKPCEVDTEFECPDRNTVSCGECKQRYWSEEVE